MRGGWRPYKTREICIICGRGGRVGHGSGCAYFGSVEAPSWAICRRVSDGAHKQTSDGQWIHRVTGNVSTPFPVYVPKTQAEINLNVEKILARYSMDTTPAMIAEFAESLSVTSDALTRLGAVWSKRHNAWAFPMWTAKEGMWELCGIRLRSASGKFTVRLSHSGLFIPVPIISSGPILVCEGPTDTAAMLSLGFEAIGRPSCSACGDLVRQYCQGRPQDVVIVQDADTPGRLGAVRLALDMRRQVKLISPLKGKDARSWKQAGATRAVVTSVIQNTRYAPRGELTQSCRELTQLMKSYPMEKKHGANPMGPSGFQSGTAGASSP